MADDGLAGTVIGIARAGIKLAVTLHNFSETVTTARIEIKDLANNVSLTASVLHELGVKLDQDDDEEDHVYSSSATGTARQVTRECEAVFREIDSIIGKAMQSAKDRGVKNGKVPALSPLERLKYPFLLPKVDLLATNLERLKSTLVLMLNVLSYARDMKSEDGESPKKQDDVYQKLLLENLIRVSKDATRRYEAMLKSLGEEAEAFQGDSPSQSRPDSNGSASASASLSVSMIKTPDSDDSYAESSPRARAASTIQACLDRVENALVKVEQSSSVLHHSSGIVVRVELDKDTRAQQGQQPQKPRISVSVLQKQTRRRQDSLQSLTNSTKRNTNGLSRSNTWYSNLWNSMPSPYSAISSIQQTLDNTGLFLATEQITEDAGNVLTYNQASNTNVNGGYQPYSNRYGSSTYANPGDNGDDSPDSESGPTLAEAFRAALPDSLISGRRPDPATRVGDIEMNPVGAQGHAHGDASRPLMSADAVENTPRLGPLPEVRVELDTPSAASTSASISRPAPVAALGSGETSTSTITSSSVATHEYRNGQQGTANTNPAGGVGGASGWSPEQDARMRDILSASVQAAIAQGESEGGKIEPPPTTSSSSPDKPATNTTRTLPDVAVNDAQKAGDADEEDAMETVDLSDTKGKGKGKAKASQPTGTGLGVLMGTSNGADAVDQLLGEWTTTVRISAGPGTSAAGIEG